jgi:hypothetical protein
MAKPLTWFLAACLVADTETGDLSMSLCGGTRPAAPGDGPAGQPPSPPAPRPGPAEPPIPIAGAPRFTG